jgi:hypothetical protein
MSLATPIYQPSRSGLTGRSIWGALSALIVVVAAVGVVAGRAGDTGPSDGPIVLVGGVPVGVEHSRAGALVAADDYLALEQQTIERNPSRFERFVAVDYAAGVRGSALAAGESARRGDPRDVALWARGGRSFTVVAAHRLDHYDGDTARISTWAAEILWGPGQPPEQVWRLGQILLRWTGGRWLVGAMRTLPAAAPSPASTPQTGSGDDTTSVFDRLLSGFAPVSYGAPTG